ncbi:hypothetical protein TNCV_1305081 [Trichonephila clavipes]|nr:hypothetical protein TNCV_1305081 [Trichonephila clavipes]
MRSTAGETSAWIFKRVQIELQTEKSYMRGRGRKQTRSRSVLISSPVPLKIHCVERPMHVKWRLKSPPFVWCGIKREGRVQAQVSFLTMIPNYEVHRQKLLSR